MFHRFKTLNGSFHIQPSEPSDPRPFWKQANLWIFLFSLGLRLLYSGWYGALLYPDSIWRYLPISEALFESWQGSEFDSPGYPIFLAMATTLGFAGPVVIFVQGFIDSFTAVMIYDIARKIGLRKGALAIGSFYAIHLGAIIFTTAILSETLFTFFVTGAAWWYIRANHNCHPRHWILAGLFLAGAALTRANGLLVTFSLAGCILLTSWSHPRWKHLLAMFTAVMMPIAIWVTYNGRTHGVWAIAKGGGWQWAQNMAYFDLIDPSTLPEPFNHSYRDWQSLSELRAAIMHDPSEANLPINTLFGDVAKQNALARPGAYALALPRSLLLPRRFIKDMTREPFLLKRPFKYQKEARQAGYGSWLEKTGRPGPFSPLASMFQLFRTFTIIPYKYTLLLLGLPFVLITALRTRHPHLLMLGLFPLAQVLPLALLLNPIERYYFPFESFMITGLVASIVIYRQTKTNPPFLDEATH